MKQLLSIRKSLIITLLMLMGMNLDAKNVNINDIAGSWKMIPDKGMVMAGDIIMNISTTSISQALYSEKKRTRTDLLNGIFYLSDIPATSWNDAAGYDDIQKLVVKIDDPDKIITAATAAADVLNSTLPEST